MRRRLVISVFPAVLGLQALPARASDQGTKALMRVTQKLLLAIDQARAEKSPSLPALRALRDRLAELEKALNGLAVGIPEEYAAAFAGYETLLDAPVLAPAAIERIDEDVQLKNAFFTGRAGMWPLNKSPLVKIRVSTYRGATESPGFRVVFNPVAMAGERDAFPFTSDTNDAQRSLPPGRYVLRLYRGDTKVLDRREDVGFDGTDDKNVRIDVSAYDNAAAR